MSENSKVYRKKEIGKMDNKITGKTIEEIENDYWPEYDYESNLIRKCHELRKVKIMDLTIENLRMLIGQNIGNEILIPVCIDILRSNILAEGDFFEGDLLKNVLNSDKNYWKNNPDIKLALLKLLKKNNNTIINMETTKEIKDDINEAIINFNK